MTESELDFYTPYKAVFTAVENAIKTKNSIKTVSFGEKNSYSEGFPAAIINIDPSPISKNNMDQLEVKINFTVILMIREEEPDDWFDEIIKVMADVVDTVLTDQTLDGSVFDCTPTGFAPGNIRFVNRVFYGGAVTFEADMHFEH